MEKTTVNDIAKLAINGLPVEDSYKAVILNNEFSVESLEKLQPAPNRLRQNLYLNTEQSLIDYANKFKVAGTASF